MAVIATSALLVGACSSDSPPDFSEMSVVAGDEVVALSASPFGAWGLGRAVLARSAGSNTVVVTTTGIFVAGGTEPVRIDTFSQPTQVGATAVSGDGSLFAVTIDSPGGVRVYDLANARTIATHELGIGTGISALAFRAGTTELLAATTDGLLAWSADPAAGPTTPIPDAPSVGFPATLPDATAIVPITGSTEVAVVGTDGTRRHDIEVAPDMSLLDAHASPSGSVVAISSGAGLDAFEREDQIVLVDPSTFERRATISLDRALSAADWVVTDDVLAVSDGSGIAVWTLDGDPVAVAEPASDQPVNAVLASTTGVVTVHRDGALVQWDANGWTSTLLDQGGVAFRDASIDATGTLFTGVDFYGSITEWNLTDGAGAVTDDRFAAGEATAVSISADAERLAVASTTGRAIVLDANLHETWSFQVGEPSPRVDAVAFNPATGFLTTGLAERLGQLAFDDTITVWDIDRRSEVYRIGGESEDVAGCAFFYNRIRFSGDGSLMTATSHDFTVSLIDAATGELLHRFPPHASSVLDVAFTPDDDLLITTSDDATVNVWNTSDYQLVATYASALGGYQAIAVLPDSATMVAADVAGSLSLVDIVNGEVVGTFPDASARTTRLALSADGSLLAAPTGAADVAIWSTDSGRQLATLTGHSGAVTDLAFSPDGTWLLTSSSDGTARTWTLDATT